MAETADSMDRHQIARLRAAVPKGVVGGNAGAEERRRLNRVQRLGHMRQRRGEREHVGGVAAVAGYAGGGVNVFAGEDIAPPAMATVAACTAEPSHPGPRTHVPAFDVWTEGVDDANHFMAGNPRVAEPWHEAFDDRGVTMANPTGLYAEADLMTARLRQVALLHAEAPAGFGNDHCTHFRHSGLRDRLNQISPR